MEQDIFSAFLHAMPIFLMGHTMFYMLGLYDIKQGCCSQYCRIPLICSAYSVGRASSIISIIRSSFVAAADGIADRCCAIFYDIVVDPISNSFESCRHNNNIIFWNLSTDIPGLGIPGRHNGKKARKKSRARPPPLWRNCVWRIRLSTKTKEKIDSPDDSIVAIGFVLESLGQTCIDFFQEWMNLLQLCITYNRKMQECLFSIFCFVLPYHWSFFQSHGVGVWLSMMSTTLLLLI